MSNSLKTIIEKITDGSGLTQEKKYARGKFLGKGGFAKCFQLTDPDSNRSFAVKVVEKSSLTKQRAKLKLMSEIKIHKQMNHPKIVHLEKYFEDKDNVYIILELCPNLSLNDMLKRRKKLTDIEV